MTSVLEMPEVTDCSVTGCGYNHDHDCHAGAVTIGGVPGDAACATFIPLGSKGGLDKVVAHVGACQRMDCVHNKDLECTAAAIRVGNGPQDQSHADCLTFTEA
ncbi:DUF1540 domain-containing protein [Isoptericola aurantiacus]|uniref:DUF1540 domain-containing protein n=1 Tax=Isoptericola aurantiacus TaxID=3377839 RepID=UPI00383B247A